MTAASGLVELTAGDLRLAIAPEIGGSVARFDWVGPNGPVPLFRTAPVGYSDVLQAACFPLVPFANRIRGGTFRCGDRTIRLAPNMPGDPSPLHGQGWRSAWSVTAATETRAELAFTHEAGAWPWDYEARQTLMLDADGLLATLTCRNLSEAVMPCGLGFHPFFPCVAQTRLDTRVRSVWTVDAQTLPVSEEPAIGRYDLHQQLICGQGLDNGFDGWSGVAHISWPERGLGLELASPDAPRFQVYAPATGGIFVAEPVTNANAALNQPERSWPSLGLTMMAQGESVSLRARFRLRHPPGS